MNHLKNLPHNPNRRQAIIFFFCSLCIAGILLLWVFFLNRGTLVVEGAAPFLIRAGAKDYPCNLPRCAILLTPRKYTLTIKKKGFYDYGETITVRWRKEIKVKPAFKFIPVASESGPAILPFENAPLRPPFLGTKRLENFPKNFKEALVSPSGDTILLKIGKEFYVYDVKNYSVKKFFFRDSLQYAWAGEDLVTLENIDEKLSLLRLNLKTEKVAPIVSFDRVFPTSKISASPSGKKILVTDENFGNFYYYLVDSEKKSRRKLDVPEKSQNPFLTEHYVFFEHSRTGKARKEIIGMKLENLELIQIPVLNTENIMEIQPGILIFVSSEKYDSDTARIGVPISEALEQAKKDVFATTRSKNSLFITEYDIPNQRFREIVGIPVTEGETLHRLTNDPDGGKWYFLKGGKLWQVLLEP